MSLCDRNCWTLSYRSAFLATIRAQNPVSMIMILTFSPTVFIPELSIAVASKTNKYDKIRLTNVFFFFSLQEMENVSATIFASAIPLGQVAHAAFLIVVL